MPLVDGRQANIVLVGPRNNPKGAVLVMPPQGNGPLPTLPLTEGLELLHPEAVIDIFAMQERAFGEAGLESPFESDKSP